MNAAGLMEEAAPLCTGATAAAVPPPATLAARAANDPLPQSAKAASAVPFGTPRGGRALALPHPITAYRGVAVTVAQRRGEPVFELSLKHDDEAYSVPLGFGTDVAAVARDWQAWARALALPLIAVEADGQVRAELTTLGPVLAERPSARRKGSPLVGRRSRYGRRRRATPPLRHGDDAPVLRGREIIART